MLDIWITPIIFGLLLAEEFIRVCLVLGVTPLIAFHFPSGLCHRQCRHTGAGNGGWLQFSDLYLLSVSRFFGSETGASTGWIPLLDPPQDHRNVETLGSKWGSKRGSKPAPQTVDTNGSLVLMK